MSTQIKIAVKNPNLVDIDDLNELQGELKDLEEGEFNQLKSEIEMTGFAFPIHVWRDKKDKLWIVGGHQRKRVLKKMLQAGYAIEGVPIVEVEAENKKEAMRRVLQDVAQYGKVNKQGLYEFMHLAEINFPELSGSFRVPDMALNMESFEKEFFLGPEQLPPGDADAVPGNTKDTKVKLGDLFILGEHRLMCGSATSIDDYDKVINREVIDLVLTDPPYGIKAVKSGVVGNPNFGEKPKGQYQDIIGDDTTETAQEFYQTCVAYGLKDFIIWGGNYFTKFLDPSASWVVWNKRSDTGMQNNFADGELAWSNLGHPLRIHNQLWMGMIREGEKEKRVHPTQKPVKLLEFCLALKSEAKNIFDPFCGSGSTLIACEKNKLKCFAIELAPHYCDVIIRRWQAYTEQAAYLLDRDGVLVPFDSL